MGKHECNNSKYVSFQMSKIPTIWSPKGQAENAYQVSRIACVLDLGGLASVLLDVFLGCSVVDSFRWTHRFADAGSWSCSTIDSLSCYSNDDVAANHCGTLDVRQCFADDGVAFDRYHHLLVISLGN